MQWTVDEYELPAPAEVVARLQASSHPFTNLVTLPPDAIVERLIEALTS